MELISLEALRLSNPAALLEGGWLIMLIISRKIICGLRYSSRSAAGGQEGNNVTPVHPCLRGAKFCIKVLFISSDVWNSVHLFFQFDVPYVASSSLPSLSAHNISVLQGKESNSALWVLIELNSCFSQVSRVRLSEDVSLFNSLSLWLCTSDLLFRLLELNNSFFFLRILPPQTVFQRFLRYICWW